MTTTSSGLALTDTATYGGAGKEPFAHSSRDESHKRSQTEMLQLAVMISRRVAPGGVIE
ncbi:hypothetical protein [Arthrobacter ginsengisoli]|nr:hypothetical protein [Arthrobacter ginsengisoli]